MIVIDTNVILASIRQPATPADKRQHGKATDLLGQIAKGTDQALIPEIVLHECFYVLTMRDGDLSVDAFCNLFRGVLEWPGWTMPQFETSIFQQALEILMEYPKLEFSDAVIAARAEAHGAELATFDTRLAKAYGGTIWAES